MKKTIAAHDLTFEPFIESPEIARRVEEMGRQITGKYKGQRPLFLSVLNGAFVFAADLLRAIDLECELAFVRLASYEGTGSSGKIRTVLGLDIPIKDRHVIVVEDIVDSGRTLHHFMDYLQKMEPASMALATLLFKPDALKFPVKIDYLGFEIPDKFVVGYGLDHDGLCRNLKDIYQLAT
ncbi:MAG: hypoxanthine phosphoribosyltransferase [Saprospiraceae bacterium]